MTVWRLITHHLDPEALLTWAKSSGRIAVGWSVLGDLRQYGSEKEMTQAVRETGNPNWSVSGTQLASFRDRMRLGDLVILSTGRRRSVVMRVDGNYEFVEQPEGDDVAYAHQRRAMRLDLDPDGVWSEAGGVATDQNGRWTLLRCQYEVSEDGHRVLRKEP